MDCLKRNLPELRYILLHVSLSQKRNYLKTASPDLMTCINEIIINLLFSHKNGIELTASQKKKLQQHKVALKKFIVTNKISEKRKLLTGKAIDAVLSTIVSIAKELEIEA